MARPVAVLVTYRPKPGAERRFFSLLRRHWATLRGAGLVTAARPRVWRATDKRTGQRLFFETFAWKDARSSDRAHHDPAVLAVWGPMEPLLESLAIATVEEVGVDPTRRPSRPAARRQAP